MWLSGNAKKTQESCYYNYYTVSKEGSTDNSWRILELIFDRLSYFDPVPSCWLCLFFFQGGTGLISLSDWSWRPLLHGDVWLLNSISRNYRSGKITGFFCIVCSFCAFLVKKSWMQSNTDHKKACLLKDFFLDIFQNVGFVCFRMCWRILMTLLLQLAVVEGHQELPLVTIWQDQNSSKL